MDAKHRSWPKADLPFLPVAVQCDRRAPQNFGAELPFNRRVPLRGMADSNIIVVVF